LAGLHSILVALHSLLAGLHTPSAGLHTPLAAPHTPLGALHTIVAGLSTSLAGPHTPLGGLHSVLDALHSIVGGLSPPLCAPAWVPNAGTVCWHGSCFSSARPGPVRAGPGRHAEAPRRARHHFTHVVLVTTHKEEFYGETDSPQDGDGGECARLLA